MALFGKKKDKSSSKAGGKGLGRSAQTGMDGFEDSDVMTMERPPMDSDEGEELASYDYASEDSPSRDLVAVDDFEIDSGLEEPKKKKGFFSKKEKKVAPAKPLKAPKAEKASKRGMKPKFGKKANEELSEEAERELSNRLSVLVEIEELPGVTKDDAIETARHQALNHSDRPSNCYFSVLETRKGFLIEVQEGVGRSYLPSVYKLAMDNPNRLVVVPMVRRKLTVVYSPKTDSFETQILSEDVDPPEINGEKALVAKRGPAMTPVFKQYQQWMTVGIGTAAIGAIALILSIGFYALDPGVKPPPEWRTTNVGQLPVMQWSQLSGGSSDSYVVRFEYSDGQWRVVRQTTFAQVEVTPQGETDSAQVIGGNVRAPSAPDATLPDPSATASYPQPGVPGAAGAPGAPVAPVAPGANPPPPNGLNQ